MPNSYKVAIRTKNDNVWRQNELRFADRGDALAYGQHLFHKWSLVRCVEVQESDEAPNTAFPVPSDRYTVERKILAA